MQTIQAFETAAATASATGTSQLKDVWWFFALIGLFMLLLTVLQISLSKSENKWTGLILPGLSVASALLASLFTTWQSTTMTSGQALRVFMLAAIPAVVWLAIYFIVKLVMRRKNNR